MKYDLILLLLFIIPPGKTTQKDCSKDAMRTVNLWTTALAPIRTYNGRFSAHYKFSKNILTFYNLMN